MTAYSDMQSRTAQDELVKLAQNPQSAFALVHRAGCASASEFVELLECHVSDSGSIAALDTSTRVLALLPFRTAADQGYECHDDGAPLLLLTVERSSRLTLETFTNFGATKIAFRKELEFNYTDAEFAALVATVQSQEIGQGECSNVVLSRTLVGELGSDSGIACLKIFENLLATEVGYYWAFLVKVGDSFFVGASPERHVSLSQGRASMTAISGTVKRSDKVEQFLQLASSKQQFELSMVVDEEIKMLIQCCDEGVHVRGPSRRVMSKVIHSEFEISGNTDLRPASLLARTIFAPSVVGSPIENAFRVISRHETLARGYYSGVVALIDPESTEDPLDSAILIRTAEIRADGATRFQVGATITKDSDGADEARETWLKAQAFINATLGAVSVSKSLNNSPSGLESAQDTAVSTFWLSNPDRPRSSDLRGLDIVIVDGEDTFSRMWLDIIRSMGARPSWRSWSDPDVVREVIGASVTILGPGPGDPRSFHLPRQQKLRELCDLVLNRRIPTVAVCLSHQIMCQTLGMQVRRRTTPNQGLQRAINWLGRQELVGYYNTFEVIKPMILADWQIETNSEDSVDFLLAERLCSIQFHPESILTPNGADLIRDCILSAAR